MEHAQNQITQGRAGAGTHQSDPLAEHHRRRAALWRAVAGMAAALMLAGLIVAYDISHQIVQTSSYYRTRIVELRKKVRRLSDQAEESEMRLATARKELAARNRIQAILLAPDMVSIKLSPPGRNDSGSGTVALSRKAGAGIFKGAGLTPPADGQVYDLWWIMKKSPPAKAGEFRSLPDGSALAYLDLPPSSEEPVECKITLEQSGGGIEPAGPVKLKARIPR